MLLAAPARAAVTLTSQGGRHATLSVDDDALVVADGSADRTRIPLDAIAVTDTDEAVHIPRTDGETVIPTE